MSRGAFLAVGPSCVIVLEVVITCLAAKGPARRTGVVMLLTHPPDVNPFVYLLTVGRLKTCCGSATILTPINWCVPGSCQWASTLFETRSPVR